MREELERALGPFLKGKPAFDFTLDYDALAESKDVITGRLVLRWFAYPYDDFHWIFKPDKPLPDKFEGNPEGYLFIGIPLEEEGV